jgi:DNA-binding transcriptional regulator GbsR (MarR family)
MLDYTNTTPVTADDIATHLKLEKSQVSAWLKRAVIERKITKLTKPVRYQVSEFGQQQASLFGDDL